MKTIENKIVQLYIDAGMSADETIRHMALIVGSGIVAKGNHTKHT